MAVQQTYNNNGVQGKDLPVAYTDVYTAPAGGSGVAVNKIHFCNKNASSRTVSLKRVLTGGAGETQILDEHPIAGKGSGDPNFFQDDGVWMLRPGDKFQALASAVSSIDLNIEVNEIS